MSIEKAKKVIERIENTLISDLKSLKVVAVEREESIILYKKLPGGLNYTLFLAGLVASETLGFFMSNDSSVCRSVKIGVKPYL